MKLFKLLIFSSVIFLFSACCSSNFSGSLTQISTIDALLDGVYDGRVTCGKLKEYGDFGIGTFDGLDGEMIVLNGQVYQVKIDGKAYLVADSMRTPFASVLFFNSEKSIEMPSGLNYDQLKARIDKLIKSDNLFYAIKIEGKFKKMITRSVPKQKKPYPQLKEVVKHQKVFKFGETSGTVVGFRSPQYVKGLNVTGYHLHYLTDNKKAGGHILDFVTDITQFSVILNKSSISFDLKIKTILLKYHNFL